MSLIALNQIEKGLSAPLTADALGSVLAPYAKTLLVTAQETLDLAGLNAVQINRVVYVGGSSLMNMVTQTMKTRFPDAQHTFTEVFSAVADGLALASAQK